MSSGRPVARLVSPIIVRLGVMAALMAAIAVLGVVLSTAAVNYLTDDLQPAAAANQNIYQDLTDMSAAVEAWSSTGSVAAEDDYQQALLRLPADQQRVRQFAAGDNELELLVLRQERAARDWITNYAAPRMQTKGGVPATPQQVRSGSQLFNSIRSAHQSTTAAFDSRVRQASTDASFRLKGTILAVVLLALGAWWVLSRSRRRLTAELTQPLLDLETVVQRMARQENDVRAQLTGPREVRAVASALNDFADGQARAHAVEGRIHNELRTLDTAKDDFVSNVSHELRTPLTTIAGYLEMVAEEFDGRMQPRHEKMLEATRRNVTRLKLLIDDLLALSRAEGRGTEMEPVDLALLLREAATDVRITAARRGIHVRVDTPDTVVPVLADRAMLHRAFCNVLTNAVKFSHQGGSVEVVLRTTGTVAEVAVTDHGIGIPAAEIDRLGTRFFRASNAVRNEIAGTGLGLRIMQTIIDKHDGDVVIDSVEGEGTTVTVHLTLQPDRVPAPTLSELVAAETESRQAGAEDGVPEDVDPSLPRIVPAFPRRS
ncbi:sensor histidine kinase [Nocardioides sp.]|uniref:sensor histidine kinase n=1 Tax=Nocardioides sp. TaxID=35761 RepID=UPI003783B0D5